jgi:phosphoglycerate dehydrogenase-like enzyme
MKTLFLGPFAARVAPTILAKMTEKIDYDTLADDSDTQRLIPLLGEAEIVVGHMWKKNFPEAPRLKFIQSTAAGLDLIDLPSIPSGVVLCNVFGHEPAIAEYVIATILALQQRLLDRVSVFRAGSWPADGPGGGTRHGEMLGATIGIVGYGRIGREVAKRAVAFGCEVIGANRSPIADPGDAAQIYPLGELDQMLPRCDVVVIAAGLAPETQGLIDARRLGLMKPGALLVNIGRARIVDEEALYAVLRDGRLGGAALDVWWRYPSPADPHARPSHLPFHELPNVLMTPHTSSASESTSERRWSVVADNLDRFVRGEQPAHIVTTT